LLSEESVMLYVRNVHTFTEKKKNGSIVDYGSGAESNKENDENYYGMNMHQNFLDGILLCSR